MIEQGIAKLVQSDAGVKAIAKSGGFLDQLPKGTLLPSWTYALVSAQATQTSGRQEPLTEGMLQIDCYGATAEIVQLAKAIDAVLGGRAGGVLPDDDATPLLMCNRVNVIDHGLDDASRTYRRTLEYHIWFRVN